MTIQQIRCGTNNFSYLIISTKKNTAIIDPGYSITPLLDHITTHHLTITHIILTHHHHDHTHSLAKIKKHYPQAKTIAHHLEQSYYTTPITHPVNHNDTVHLDEITLTILHTPGHTPGSICILANNTALLTGDTLFINDCGRTDLPGGNLNDMYQSLHTIIKPLPHHLIIYPGHDYGPTPTDTLGKQKETNKTLTAPSFTAFTQLD